MDKDPGHDSGDLDWASQENPEAALVFDRAAAVTPRQAKQMLRQNLHIQRG